MVRTFATFAILPSQDGFLSIHFVVLLPLDVIDMLDVILESNDGEMEEFGPSLSDDVIIQTFPFSVLVPAALEARNNLAANRSKAIKNK